MKRDTKARSWLRGVTMVVTAGLAACCSAGMGDAVDEDVDTISSNLWGGYKVTDCTTAETLKIHDAIGVLLKTGTTGYSAYKSCLVGAALVENKCTTGVTIADYIRRDDVTKIQCVNFTDPGTAGDAKVGISGEKMRLDRDWIAKLDKKTLAGVIVHELMHNRGFRHEKNPYGSTFYDNTVPEQAFGCLVNGKAFPYRAGGKPPNQDCSPACPDERPYCCQVLQGTNTCTRCAIDRSFCQ